MATIKEIAKKANVSIATVSNILNHKGGASEETVKKVMAVVREYHYTPNYNAAQPEAAKHPILLGLLRRI